MNILKRMNVIWPSAWRALELLTGAKAQLDRPLELPMLRGVTSEPRLKRAAEEPADAEDVTITDGSRVLSHGQVYHQQADYPVLPPSSQGQASHTASHAQHGYALSLDLPQAGPSTTYIPPAYDRWPADSSALSNFSGSLSTSVLPQTYSTGLVDERMATSMGRSSERHSQRYPQYWNDYSALGQMEATYSVPVMGEMVSQHGGAQHPAGHGQQQPMYVPNQYPMFGEFPCRRSRLGGRCLTTSDIRKHATSESAIIIPHDRLPSI